ncbi:precorrin-8X methylmutase [Cyanobacterium stanieri PCC 7202]|uniref:Precorrin-8X methylmutase n=1 Tax=Cyanobacterium stanieri (strain ATCC 29140 / PCC 7202) TaxID=292563 RepID=K9YMR5_CYASC|nr:precorrin-8X methylmutase [Cyanobacterium stanieri PCC 7202]
MTNLSNPIIEKSFAIIDEIVGQHSLTFSEYEIARRIIHTTADFDYLNLLYCSPRAIALTLEFLKKGTPIVTDVSMIKEGIKTMVGRTFQNQIIVAVKQAPMAEEGKTRTETGMLRCIQKYPEAIYIVGNAPTALLALCEQVKQQKTKPPVIIGVPVGFVAVLEAKEALRQLDIPQIQIQGNKGGSTVAAAILNALLVMAYRQG